MSDLSTTFMGIELRNPIVVGACHLTATIRKLKACEKAGAGAVVLKSIFEELVRSDAKAAVSTMKSPSNTNRQAILDELGENLALDEYLALVEEAKKALSIPVIASIHCQSPRTWEEYASRLEEVGADGLQLNLYSLGSAVGRGAAQIEKGYLDAARRVRRRVKLPIAAKIGMNLTSPAGFAESLREVGMDALVMFNRFYGPDVDIHRMKLTAAPVLSSESESLAALRWIGLLSGKINLDFAGAGGVHGYEDVVKQLLVGARCVEMCTALYTNGLDHIGRTTTKIEGWMKRHKLSTLSDFRGRLRSEEAKQSEMFESSQYVELQSRSH